MISESMHVYKKLREIYPDIFPDKCKQCTITMVVGEPVNIEFQCVIDDEVVYKTLEVCTEKPARNEVKTNDTLLKPIEVDLIFRYPSGRTNRLIRKGKIKSITLPDGSIRVKQSEVDRLLRIAETRPTDES